jgi:D-glutamate N-acetyltransferase
MILPENYLIFLGDVASPLDAKTAFGLRDWRPEVCVGQWRLPACRVDLGLPERTPAQAAAAGARTLVIGVAPVGGQIADAWVAALVEALDAGLDVASGMHTRLRSVPTIAAAADRTGRSLFDVRHSDERFPVATGRRRSGRRLLTVGTDCAAGKKYAALSITRAMKSHGIHATFRATGQTGILIAGSGVAIDAVVADFAAGAAECLSPDNEPDHWDVIEGQGSLFHPAYAGVTTALLHGSQPDALVVCHDPGRETMDAYPEYPVPDLRRCIDANLEAARLTNPGVLCAGLALNTSPMAAEERARFLEGLQERFGLPCFDPIATGADALVDHLLRVCPSVRASAPSAPETG